MNNNSHTHDSIHIRLQMKSCCNNDTSVSINKLKSPTPFARPSRYSVMFHCEDVVTEIFCTFVHLLPSLKIKIKFGVNKEVAV